MTTTHAKFMFDQNFEVTNQDEEDRTILLKEHEQLLADARREAYAEGLQEGISNHEAKEREALGETVQSLLATAESYTATLEDDRKELHQEALDLAKTIGFTLAENLLAEQPMREIEALMRDCLSSLRDTPHLVLRVNSKYADSIKATMDSLSSEMGFRGNPVIMGEDQIDQYGCQIEWADGGAKRDTNATRIEIKQTIENYMQAKFKRTGSEDGNDEDLGPSISDPDPQTPASESDTSQANLQDNGAPQHHNSALQHQGESGANVPYTSLSEAGDEADRADKAMLEQFKLDEGV